jgi:hypothetical protein
MALPEGQFKVSTEYDDESYQYIYCNRCTDDASTVAELDAGSDLVNIIAKCVAHLATCENIPDALNRWDEYGYVKEND